MPISGLSSLIYYTHRHKNEPKIWNTKSCFFAAILTAIQAQSSWQWHRYLIQQIRLSGLSPSRLNLDETSVVLNHDDEKGVVHKTAKGKNIFVKKKSKKRGSLTHAALVCDDTSLQPLLPQLIIGNDNVLRVSDLTALESVLPKNVMVVRAKSSWITIELMIVLLEMLRNILDVHKVTRLPVLLLDCCPVHLHARVWRAARAHRIYLCFVPASLTWLLQPLDVKILRRLKACIRALYHRSQISSQSAFVPVVQIIKNLTQAIRTVLQGNAWAPAFDACGYSTDMSRLTSQIKTVFADAGITNYEIPSNKPDTEQLMNMLPRKGKYELTTLFWEPQSNVMNMGKNNAVADGTDETTAKKIGVPSSSSTGFPGRFTFMQDMLGDDEPIALRTRSHSRLLVDTDKGDHVVGGISSASASCQSSMPLVDPVQPLHTTTRKRARAQALPFPKRPTR